MENTEQKALRVGTTEGRFRMAMPELLARFEEICPGVSIRAQMGSAEQLREWLAAGELDIAFSGLTPQTPACIGAELLLDEKLYLVISDAQLRRYFPQEYPACIEEFAQGADLARFVGIPFCRSLPHLHCMKILDHVLENQGVTLNCIHVSGHFDLHQQLARSNYAACFSLSMYLPYLYQCNETAKNKLYAFPIRSLQETNPVYILTVKDKQQPAGAAEFISLLKEFCRRYEPQGEDHVEDH